MHGAHLFDTMWKKHPLLNELWDGPIGYQASTKNGDQMVRSVQPRIPPPPPPPRSLQTRTHQSELKKSIEGKYPIGTVLYDARAQKCRVKVAEGEWHVYEKEEYAKKAFVATTGEYKDLQASEELSNIDVIEDSPRKSEMDKINESALVPQIQNLSMRELRAPEFQALVNNAFNLGRQEIADAARVVSRLGDKSFTNDTENVAFQAMKELRSVFEKLDPQEFQGNKKIFGLIPIPVRRGIISYLEKFKSSTELIDNLVGQLEGASKQLVSDTDALSDVHQQLVSSLNKLDDISANLCLMEKQVEEQLPLMDKERADYVESELLYNLRRNIQAVEAQKATQIQGIVNIESQRRAARSLINGCHEMQTMGAATLSLAVDLARTQGFQITVMTALTDGRAAINNLISSVARMNAEHADKIIEFESKPLQDVDNLGEAIKTTVATIDKIEKSRITNGKVVKQNTEKLRALLAAPALTTRLELEAGIERKQLQVAAK